MQPAWYASKLYHQAINIFCILFLALGYQSSTFACPPGTDISIQNTGLNITTPNNFDPFSSTGIRYGSTLSIKNNSTSDCANVKLTFTDTVAPNQLQNGAEVISFEITPTGTATPLINQDTGIVVGSVLAGAEVAVKIDVVIPVATTTAAPGEYSNSSIKLSLSAEDAGEVDNTKSLFVATSVGTLLNINIGGAEYIPGTLAPHTMDFGSLKAGVNRSINVTTRANVNHSLQIASEHGGKLAGPQPATNYYVPYEINFGGVVLNLTNVALIPLGAKTTLNGSIRVLKATITNIGTVRAGLYKDVITLTVTSEY